MSDSARVDRDSLEFRAIRDALAGDPRLVDLDPDDLDEVAATAASALDRLAEDCTCGYGGVHEPENRRCNLNQT